MDNNIIVLKYVFESQLNKLINDCGLPIYVIEPILKGVYSDINKIYTKTLMEEYEKIKGGKKSDEVHIE